MTYLHHIDCVLSVCNFFGEKKNVEGNTCALTLDTVPK